MNQDNFLWGLQITDGLTMELVSQMTVRDLKSPEKIILINNALIGVSCESGKPSLVIGLPVMRCV